MAQKPGPILLFGSGETSPTGRKIFDTLFQTLPAEPKIALLETPAGFEPNSEMVIGKVANFLRQRLQNYDPQITIIAARHRSTEMSPDNPEVVAPLLHADMIFLGPGSPTYAVRQLQGSLAWDYILARHRLGAALVFASAAAIAASTFALPVYEIFKVGDDLHWKPGLDLFGQYQVPLVFIPHWNNNDGGDELDTSRCYMGRKRFLQLVSLLPPGIAVVGVDEKTALMIHSSESDCRVLGLGSVTIVHAGHQHETSAADSTIPSDLKPIAKKRKGHIHRYGQDESFNLRECFPLKVPKSNKGLPQDAWRQALDAEQRDKPETPPEEVEELLKKRRLARDMKDWDASDALRDQIAAWGWRVVDTPNGQQLIKQQKEQR